MAEKKVVAERKVTREGKVYQLKKSASRAAREDGLKDNQFELKESARQDGWYYIKKISADDIIADMDPDEIEDIKNDKSLDPVVEVPAVQEKLTKVVTDPDYGTNPVRDEEKVRTVVENSLSHVTMPAGNPVVTKLVTKMEEPPPLPSEKVTTKEKKPPSTTIPMVHKSTIEWPTKAVWAIAEEMHAANPNVRRKQVMDECVRRGVAFWTARTQYQQWRTAKLESDRNASKANNKK